jgi:hypothetical protein
MSVWPDRCRMVDRCFGARVCLYHDALQSNAFDGDPVCAHTGKGAAALAAEIDVALANPSPFSAVGDEALATMGSLIVELQRMLVGKMRPIIRAAEKTPGLRASVAVSLVSTLVDHTLTALGGDILDEIQRREKGD